MAELQTLTERIKTIGKCNKHKTIRRLMISFVDFTFVAPNAVRVNSISVINTL